MGFKYGRTLPLVGFYRKSNKKRRTWIPLSRGNTARGWRATARDGVLIQNENTDVREVSTDTVQSTATVRGEKKNVFKKSTDAEISTARESTFG